MISSLEVKNEIESLTSLQIMVEAYQEIAAMRMRRAKGSVLRNREFLAGLSSIYAQVKASYRQEFKEILKKARKKGSKSSSVAQKNGRTVSVLLLANTMLYGDILRKTYKKFIGDIKDIETDVVIVGRVGLQFYKDSGLTRPYEYFDLSDSGVDDKNIWEIIKYVVNYEKITVYHGKFENVLTQVPVDDHISGEVVSEEKETPVVNVRSIFEPTFEEVLVFFETEILASLFEQTVLESNLSKFASRMISLDSATVSIKESLEKAMFERQRIKHYQFNKKQLAALSGISLWGSY